MSTMITLKTAFREVCDMMLENVLDLEQVYKDQALDFFEKGIKINRHLVTFYRGYWEVGSEREESVTGFCSLVCTSRH